MSKHADDHPRAPLPDEELIAEYLAMALERLDRGESLDLGRLCADRLDLLPTVAQALGLRGVLPDLQQSSLDTDLLSGRVLADRYRLEEPIGRGAVGTVFRAHDTRLGRDVAIKLLHQGLFASPEVEARFRREAEVLAHHEHAHIVRIHDQGRAADGTMFLVTELLRGKSLHALLEGSRAAMPNGPSSASFAAIGWLAAMLPDAQLEHSYLRQIVVWIAQLADGLHEAHARGVFHRDVKPSNVFLRQDGTAVLLDFGIAARSGDATIALPHSIVGTPCYMAPEQAVGRSEPHASIDVYGLAATLYHLLTLQPPHAGDLQTVLAAVRTEDPKPAAALHQGLPRDLQAILDHGLERSPTARYQDMRAMADDLRSFLDHRPVSVRPLSAMQRSWRTCRRRPARSLAAVLGVGVVLLLAVVVPLMATVEASAASREHAERMAHLPGDLSIEGTTLERLLVRQEERAVVLGELDWLIAFDGSDLSVRLMRAAELLDSGETVAAAADFTDLQRRADSDYLREIAKRYAAVAAGQRGCLAVDLSGLPDPITATDHFVAGFHALRRRGPGDCELAEELLTRCVEFTPARDLRLLAMLGKKKPDAEQLIAEASWLEGHYGRPTARTRHTLAVAMQLQRRYDAAIGYCEDSLRLRPDRHGPWNNLGYAYLRSGNREQARHCFEKAIALRPWFPNSLAGLAQTLRDLGELDLARATIDQMQDIGWREWEHGCVAIELAAAALATGDEPARRAHAEQAAVRFHAAAAVPEAETRNPRYAVIGTSIAYAEALAGEDRAAAVLAFARWMRSDARNPRQLANLARVLKNQPVDDACRDALRLVLLEIAVGLAPGDEPLVKQRNTLRTELAAPK